MSDAGEDEVERVAMRLFNAYVLTRDSFCGPIESLEALTEKDQASWKAVARRAIELRPSASNATMEKQL